MTSKQLARLLSEAETAYFIVADTQRPGCYRFTHAFVRDTLYLSLDSHQRAQLHRRVGEALERVAGNGAQPHFAELAFHFSQAATEDSIIAKALTLLDEALSMAQTINMELTAQHIISLREQARRALPVRRPTTSPSAQLQLVRKQE